MPNIQKPLRPRNMDVQCLKCGFFNIPENRICGHCGANLPLVYDNQGVVFHWEDAEGYEGLTHQPDPNPHPLSVNQTRWIIRALILLGAFLFAIYIMNHHAH